MDINMLNEPAASPIQGFLRRFPAKYLALALGIVAVAAAFPDIALTLAVKTAHAVWFVLHTVIGVLELSIEHLVEMAFHVSRHTAQLITAWILLFMFLSLAIWLARRYLPRSQPSAPNPGQDSDRENRP